MNPLIEFHLRLRLGERIVIRLELDRSVVPWRGACGRVGRLADVLENRPHRWCLDNKGDDLHVGTAVADACRILSHLVELSIDVSRTSPAGVYIRPPPHLYIHAVSRALKAVSKG